VDAYVNFARTKPWPIAVASSRFDGQTTRGICKILPLDCARRPRLFQVPSSPS
jgi:hypothetical protein